ncbi:MAG: hypothetical protein KQJ78_11225 [Deltaproteobacteria bacterium]|nr:hypothetical protein [Deltaproteobacteria bacterium]
MSTPETDRLRRALVGLCPDAKTTVSHAQLYLAMGAVEEPQKARIRTRCQDLVRRGELERLRPGVYRYNPEGMPVKQGESYQRVWRAIRAQRPGWTYQDLAQVTRVCYTVVRRYCGWLEDQGYIAPHGREGNTRLWRTTSKARNRQTTPFPPAKTDPFEAERGAACRLVRLMMVADPSRPHIRAKILINCQQLTSRFSRPEKGENDDDLRKDQAKGCGA